MSCLSTQIHKKLIKYTQYNYLLLESEKYMTLLNLTTTWDGHSRYYRQMEIIFMYT